MTRFRAGIIGLLALTCVPQIARAETATNKLPFINCGDVTRSNASWQIGTGAWVQYIVETSRSLNVCPLEVVAEAWITGVPNSALTNRAFFYASVSRQVPVPYWGTWSTNGKHWFIWAYVTWYQAGTSLSQATVRPPQTYYDPAAACASQGADYYWNGGECVWTPGSPIIVDTAGDGYQLTSVADGVRFDLNADGTAEQVAWTRADSDDAFLAMDRNGNGRIDDGSELFGNHTPVYADRSDISTLNGFEALKFTEGPSYGASYADSRIDARDAVFSRLLLWRDANHNGISEPDELQPVGAAGVTAISTEYKTKRRVDAYGNEFRQKGTITWGDAEAPVYDVWLMWRE
jgi:hypothetical protein